ncbi:MAG: HDIG domain-containing metalloprotein [Parcubacteria group bacterium]|jgi:putative nucleotidyltransferase with HDIG domain
MENIGITREGAMQLVDRYITDPVTRLHLRESEEVMRALARHFGEDEDVWGIAGLLHDIDWDQTKNEPAQHCVMCQEILRDAGATEFLITTIISHGYANASIPALTDQKRTTRIQHSLAAAETVTGLVIASALMQPDKKLASVSAKSLKKKFKTKSFAARCDRAIIKECEDAGIPLDEFLTLSLTALQGIGDELGM